MSSVRCPTAGARLMYGANAALSDALASPSVSVLRRRILRMRLVMYCVREKEGGKKN
jgi:hypothetical protein